tara:strand:- start:117 stop:857 length:741 start_codon:yes stop_codon:yes gene_type:complete
MSIFKYILSGTLGFQFGGPIGLVLAVAATHFMSKAGSQGRIGGMNFSQQETVYHAGLISLAAALAKKGDGKVTKSEIEKFKKIFRVNQSNTKVVKSIWDAAVESNHKYEEFAQQIYSVCRNNPQLREQVIYVLFEIAAADSDVSSGEIRFIKKVASILHIDEPTYQRIKNSQPYFNSESPYKVLGVKELDSTAHIKNVYRKLSKKYHPDSLRSQNVKDESIIKTARDHFSTISTAYSQIMKSRGEK